MTIVTLPPVTRDDRARVLKEQLRETLAAMREIGLAWDDVRVMWIHAINAQIQAEMPRPEDYQ